MCILVLDMARDLFVLVHFQVPGFRLYCAAAAALTTIMGVGRAVVIIQECVVIVASGPVLLLGLV